MAVLAGYDANVNITTLFTNLSLEASCFSFNYRTDVNTYETFTTQWKYKQTGTQDCVGSMSGILKDGAKAISSTYADFTRASFVITTSSGETMTFASAVLSNISITKGSVGGEMEMSCDFESSGAITFATG